MEQPSATDAEAKARRRRQLQAVVLLIGLVGLGLAVRATVDEAHGVELPGPVELGTALTLTWCGLGCAAQAWVALIGPPADRRLVAAALYQSQLVKYLPAGGVAQAAGQVTMTAMHDVPVRRVTLAYVLLGVATTAAGLAIGAGLVAVDELPAWCRALALLGLLAPLLLHRPLLARLLEMARRRVHRLPETSELPDQRTLWRVFGWCVANQLLYAAGFVVLLRATAEGVELGPALVGYVVAWVAGFLVLPLPSGLGVREAVLLAVVPGVTTGPLLAASLAQRLVAITAEVASVVGNKVLRHLR